ncbi:MAG: endopeptidase La [Candidatus Hydrogenedentes bacterium]|nr:endopeptidase La [Candidatus Hydrogenedentota bacterium]
MSEQSSTPAPPPTEVMTELPDTLPLILLTNQVVFPMSVVPIRLTSQTEMKLVDDAVMGNKLLALVAYRGQPAEGDGIENAHEIGCIGRVLQLQRSPEGSLYIAVQSLKRFRIQGVVQREPYPVVKVEPLQDPPSNPAEVAPLTTTVKLQMSRVIALSPNVPEAASTILENIEDPGFLADLVAGNLNISTEEKQKILATLDVKQRLERLIFLLAREVELLEISTKIQNDVKSSIDKGQREFFLRQQLKAIQDELGEGDGSGTQIKEYREKMESRGLPDEVKQEATRELNRLAQMNEASAEYHVITTYLDWVVELPWSAATVDQLDIGRAEEILNEDHYGLEKVKRRILEYLAVRKLKPDAHGPILCFVGPPGVGKTSLGKSIARALGRKFVRMSLGGMRDEAEIRGHRKTYVGALPGRILQNIRKAQSNNPVFMLDEIDKVGTDFRGDPSSALLEVLDPAQNDTFTDLYLNVAFNLSKVMFIATANILDTIPWALRDRMEVIEIPGYTLEEKLKIAYDYLVPRQVEAHGLTLHRLNFTPSAIKEIIASYTQEAGVRNLEREVANVCRACARTFANGRRAAIAVNAKGVSKYLGKPKVFHDVAERTRMPGVATGLAWTVSGGDILFVEATRMPGEGKLVLTGQLGDVMRESAQAALSYIRSNAEKFGIPTDIFKKYDIHIHLPAGAVPKDGPSAGVALLTAVASLLVGRRVKNGLAMTGEITLRGQVLPVGGIKEKVLAATRARIKEIIVPDRNRNDLDDVPETARRKVHFFFVKRMEEVLRIALDLTL